MLATTGRGASSPSKPKPAPLSRPRGCGRHAHDLVHDGSGIKRTDEWRIVGMKMLGTLDHTKNRPRREAGGGEGVNDKDRATLQRIRSAGRRHPDITDYLRSLDGWDTTYAMKPSTMSS